MAEEEKSKYIDYDKLDADTKKDIAESMAINEMVNHSSGWKVFIEFIERKKNDIDKSWEKCKNMEQINALKAEKGIINEIVEFVNKKVAYAKKSKEVLDKEI